METVRSEAYPLPSSPGPESIRIAARLGKMPREHAVLDQAGRYYPAGTHFYLQRDPDTVLWTHGAFISRKHGKPPKSQVGWIEAAPDLVIEARSPSDINRRLDQKIAWWQEFGVKLVWVIDAEEDRIEVY